MKAVEAEKERVAAAEAKLEQVKTELAESQKRCANAYAAAWKTAEGRPEMSIDTTASEGRSGDVESLNEASSPACDMDTQAPVLVRVAVALAPLAVLE